MFLFNFQTSLLFLNFLFLFPERLFVLKLKHQTHQIAPCVNRYNVLCVIIIIPVLFLAQLVIPSYQAVPVMSNDPNAKYMSW